MACTAFHRPSYQFGASSVVGRRCGGRGAWKSFERWKASRMSEAAAGVLGGLTVNHRFKLSLYYFENRLFYARQHH